MSLVAQFELPEASGRQLQALLDIVERDPSAPTAVVDPARAVEVHIADSLDGLRAPAVREAQRVADLGAGAGFPGLALASALPRAEVSVVDSVGRKCDFMRRAVTAAKLTNVDVVHARAEDWSEGIERHDLVTARAVAPLSVLVEYAAPLLALHGTFVAWKSTHDSAEDADGLAAAAATGLQRVETLVVPSRPGAEHRRLHVYAKVGVTPARFPRRPGMARKRPISASN